MLLVSMLYKLNLNFEENIKQLSKFDNHSYRLWVEKCDKTEI